MGGSLPETLTQRAGDRNLVEWCCDSRNRAAEYKGSWDERPRCLVGVVARRPLRGHVCSRRSADSLLPVRWCGNAAFDFEHMGHRRTPQRSGDLLAFPRFSPGGGPDRLQAPQEPYRLDLPGRRSLLDVHRRRSLHPRFRILPCDYRCATPVDLGTARGAPWDLYDPALPGWEASIEVVAPVCVVLRGGDGSD